MPTKGENYQLLLSMIKQLNISGRAINWKLAANDLGLERGKAASLRWHRFKKAQRENGVWPVDAEDVRRKCGTGRNRKREDEKKKGKMRGNEMTKTKGESMEVKEREVDLMDDDEGENFGIDSDEEA
jgi:hypothetical protein